MASRAVAVAVSLTALGLLAACGGGSGPAAPGSTSVVGAASASSATASSVGASTIAEAKDTRPPAERCFTPGLAATEWSAPDGSRIAGATLGTGDPAIIYLHSNYSVALCEGAAFATLAAAQGMRVVLVDACFFGASRCTDELAARPADVAALVAADVRAKGARRLVVLGSSMGGAAALGAGPAGRADGVVDVSGPSSWQGTPDVADAIGGLVAAKIPTLVVYSTKDQAIGPATIAEATAGKPGVTVLTTPNDGHGISMLVTSGTPAALTPLGRQALSWIAALPPRS